MSSLLEWLYLHKKSGYKFLQYEHGIVLDLQFANKFLLGIPKNKKWGKNPFIAVQRREAIFLNLLNIDKILIKKQSPKIHFLCKGIPGLGSQFPSIPPFYITLTLDVAQKSDTISLSKNIDLRGYWFDDGNIEIATNEVVWSRPIEIISSEKEILSHMNIGQENENNPETSIKSLFSIKIPTN